MPYFGLFPFLLKQLQWQGILMQEFQCPTSGFFLFYGKESFMRKLAFDVSMPYFGLFPFLRPYSMETRNNKYRFNALLRAFSFSTGYLAYRRMLLTGFQCPTSGFFLFYISTSTIESWRLCLFQCPTSGFFLFYTFELEVQKAYSKVSMPYFGLFPFLRYVSTAIDFTGFPASIL